MGTDSVAVGADHLALAEFFDEALGAYLVDESRNFARLVAQMVEVHDIGRERLPTVGAGLALARVDQLLMALDPLASTTSN
jgi:hypothetical protein